MRKSVQVERVYCKWRNGLIRRKDYEVHTGSHDLTW
jgi:hypothetical protein